MPRAIDYGNLDTRPASLDQALYVASCLCGASADDTAHIFSTTERGPGLADPSTGEGYWVISGDDLAEMNPRPDGADYCWHLSYTIRRGERR